VIVTPIEGIDPTPTVTAMVAVVHAILAQLSAAGTRGPAAAVEQAWESMGLMDDQP